LSKVWVESLNAASALVSEVTKTRRKVESEEWFSRDQIEMEMTADQEWWAIQAAEAARREMVRPVEEVERLQRQVIIQQQANAVQNIEQIWRRLELESEQCIHRTETINAAEGGWFALQTYQANVRARLALRGDLQSLLDALPIQEADARSQIEGEHQNGLEAVCSWLDSMMDDEDLRVVIHEESAQRTDLWQQAMQRWTSGDLGQTAGALRAMAASEQRLSLVVQEARARSVLHGREADHRTTYTRVWQRWHLECAEVEARAGLQAECDAGCMAILKDLSVSWEHQRLHFIDKELRSRDTLMKLCMKERSTIEGRATAELHARQGWMLLKEELKVREGLEQLQNAARVSIRRQMRQDYEMELLVEQEMLRRTSILEEPMHFWQQVQGTLELHQAQRDRVSELHSEGMDDIATEQASAWLQLEAESANIRAETFRALYHLLLEIEWDNRDLVEDEEDDAFDEILNAASRSLEAAPARTLARLEQQHRLALAEAEQAQRFEAVLEGRRALVEAEEQEQLQDITDLRHHHRHATEARELVREEAGQRLAVARAEQNAWCDALLLDPALGPEDPPWAESRASTPALIHGASGFGRDLSPPWGARSLMSSQDHSLSGEISSENSSVTYDLEHSGTPTSVDRAVGLSSTSATQRRKLQPLPVAAMQKELRNSKPKGKRQKGLMQGKMAAERQRLTDMCHDILQSANEVLCGDVPKGTPKLPPLVRANVQPPFKSGALRHKQFTQPAALDSGEMVRDVLPLVEQPAFPMAAF
jgi:hypothetical protein